MPDIKTIADRADVIVNGYAFERKTDGIHVLNLNHPDKASVFNSENEAIEGSTYVTKGNLVNLNEAIMALKSIDWFCKSVRDIRAFRIEEWSDFTPSFKKDR